MKGLQLLFLVLGLSAANVTVADEPVEIDFLKSIVNQELSFVYQVCSPSESQMSEVVAAARLNLQQMSAGVDQNQRFFRADETFFGPNGEQLNFNPLIRSRVDAAIYLKTILSSTQYETYVSESKHRDDFERSAAISIALDLLNQHLCLNETQRSSIADRMLQSWTTIDLMSMKNYENNPNYLPNYPAGVIEPDLSDEQKKLMAQLRSRQTTIYSHFNEDADTAMVKKWLP